MTYLERFAASFAKTIALGAWGGGLFWMIEHGVYNLSRGRLFCAILIWLAIGAGALGAYSEWEDRHR